MDSSSSSPADLDDVLSGTTLRVYRFMISKGNPVGPRELQRSLHFSSPGVATFHLDKLLRAGLVSKSTTGSYLLERVYLKHYVRVRRALIPKYTFYAMLSTFFLVGWIILVTIPEQVLETLFGPEYTPQTHSF